jgi:hypothetical protein
MRWTILKFSLKKPKMQEKHLYEYSVIRVVPRVEREEFLNVGIIVFAKKRSHKDALYYWCGKDGTVFCFRFEQLELNLESFQKIAHGTKQADPLRNLIFHPFPLVNGFM